MKGLYSSKISREAACAEGFRHEIFHAFPSWVVPTSDEVCRILKLACLTVSGAANMLGVSETLVSQWRRGVCEITYAHWMILVQAAGLGAMWDTPRKYSTAQRTFIDAGCAYFGAHTYLHDDSGKNYTGHADYDDEMKLRRELAECTSLSYDLATALLLRKAYREGPKELRETIERYRKGEFKGDRLKNLSMLYEIMQQQSRKN